MAANETSTTNIRHRGVVESVDSYRRTVRVRLTDAGECESCAASKLCGAASAKKPEYIDVETSIAGAFRPGDEVMVVGTELMHRRAIMLATVLPCVLLVAIMVGVYALTGNQLTACLCGLGSTLVFFVVLWLARNRIAHEFRFTIRK